MLNLCYLFIYSCFYVVLVNYYYIVFELQRYELILVPPKLIDKEPHQSGEEDEEDGGDFLPEGEGKGGEEDD